MPPKQPKKVKEEPETCSICASNYTAIIRKKIICKYCKKDACSKCIELYLLQRIEDAHCVHCRVLYDDIILNEICTKTYLQNRYFKHRQDVLVNRERSLLPGLQDEAIRERKKRDTQHHLDKIRFELSEIVNERSNALIRLNVAITQYDISKKVGDPIQLNETRTHLLITKEECDTIGQKFHQHRDLFQALLQERYFKQENDGEDNELADQTTGSAAASDHVERKKFIRRCTRSNCQGFLSTAWKCGICEYYSCNKCFKEKGMKPDDPHECSKGDLDTAELIRKDSKPCPNCGEFITKGEGCDQMFCVSCQTPFSWNTGKIITSGVIHNPHYYEWLTRNGNAMPRNPADVPCGGYPLGWELHRLRKEFIVQNPYLSNHIVEFHRICMEIQDASTRNWQHHLTQDAANKINVKFLLGDYAEKRWGQLLAQLERKKKRDREVQEIFAAFRMVAVELINRYQGYNDPVYGQIGNAPIHIITPILQDIYTECTALFIMINDAFQKLSLQNRCLVPYIVDNKNQKYVYYQLLTKNYATDMKSKKIQNEVPVQAAAAAAAAPAPVFYYDSDDNTDDDSSDNEIEPDIEQPIIPPPNESALNEEDTELQLAIIESLHIH